ncbi:MAG: S49 family peptidase [Gammaproteobacteria bacterium]|nr:MAG: S49 family peptidase [Gammaproteobacteria bacterium]
MGNNEINEIAVGALAGALDRTNEELRSQRRSTYIRLALKGLFFLIVTLLVVNAGKNGLNNKSAGNKFEAHVAEIDITGPIMDGQSASADKIILSVQNAYESPNVKAVVLRINSPGGSPVQAGIVFDELLSLKDKHKDIPLYAVIDDLGASAAYYIAASADKIYVDKASMVGSIGVISSGFGYTDLMQKLGVERRLYTSGANKGLLDPYSPVNDGIKTHWNAMLGDIHQQFISSVKKGRGERLAKDNPDLFSGLIWTGEKSKELGLSDEIGNMLTVSRFVLAGKINIVNYTEKPDLMSQLSRKASAEFHGAMINLTAPYLQ